MNGLNIVQWWCSKPKLTWMTRQNGSCTRTWQKSKSGLFQKRIRYWILYTCKIGHTSIVYRDSQRMGFCERRISILSNSCVYSRSVGVDPQLWHPLCSILRNVSIRPISACRSLKTPRLRSQSISCELVTRSFALQGRETTRWLRTETILQMNIMSS
jgi:hypothetical protein